MAETGAVFDVQPPVRRARRGPRSRSCTRNPAAARTRRVPVNRWYTTDITAGRDVTIGKIFDEAGRRDPGRQRTWIALADGDIYQLGLIQDQAAARGVTRSSWSTSSTCWNTCGRPPGASTPPATRPWKTGSPPRPWTSCTAASAAVIARIRQLTGDHPPKPGGEHEKIIRKTLHYLDAKQPYLDYPRALANGWPIATGVIEGACRHLVNDRIGITGARWGLPGAQAILWLRAINASGDLDAYWDWHIQQEHQRNHLSR